MRGEIALALLHSPEIIFLDEPTIGLDVVAKRKLRKTLKDLNEQDNVTLFLTSHDAGDIEFLSNRTIIINHGRVVMDDKTENIRKNILTFKLIRVEYKNNPQSMDIHGCSIQSESEGSVLYRIDIKEHDLNSVIREIIDRFEVVDLDVLNPSLEEVIENIFSTSNTNE